MARLLRRRGFPRRHLPRPVRRPSRRSAAGHRCAKTDLAAAQGTQTLIARLHRINPLASLWRSAGQELDAEALIGRAGRSADWLPADVEPAHDHRAYHHAAHGQTSRHDGEIRSIALAFDGALDWTMFGIWLTMLLHRHGNEVLRVKGILNVAGTDRPVAVHGVQHLVHSPTHMSAWPDHERRSRLVLIVKGVDPAAIERSSRAFGLRPTPEAPRDGDWGQPAPARNGGWSPKA